MTAREALPWEIPGRSLDGRGSLDPSWRAAFVGPSSRRGARASTDTRSGLTRRGIIYEYIRNHPGAHVRGMGKDLRLGTGDLQYHLLWLERHGFVKTRKGGFYRFVYPTMVFKEDEELLLAVLSQETPREILLTLMHEEEMTQGEIAKALGHSQPTVSWHMDRLVRHRVVNRRRQRIGVVYSLAADRESVLNFVKTYHPGVWKRWSGKLSGILMSVEVSSVEKRGGHRKLAG